MSLETDLERARDLDVDRLADAVESIGFECTRCGACCKGYGTGDGDREPHTATVFPDEIRTLREAAGGRDAGTDGPDGADATGYDWRDVARPMPYGLRETDDGLAGETFEWALAVDDCGDCTFYEETDGVGACTVHDDRPLICETYPFSVVLAADAADGERPVGRPMGEAVDREGPVRAHECEGLGRDIDRGDAEELAAALKRRAVRELKEAIAVRDRYAEADPGSGPASPVVVYDSEGAKTGEGDPIG